MTIEQNFQPQGRDTSNGPHVHTYIPRADGSIMIGGVAYHPQNQTQPTVSAGNATQIPVVVKPGEEGEVITGAPVGAIPLPRQVQMMPQFIHPQAYYGHFPIQQVNYGYHASAFPFSDIALLL